MRMQSGLRITRRWLQLSRYKKFPHFQILLTKLNFSESNSTDSSSRIGSEDNEEDVLYQKDAIFDAQLNTFNESNEINQNISGSTTQGPRLEQKLTDMTGQPKATLPLPTEKPCPLDCGLGGGCMLDNNSNSPICLCPLGKSGDHCEKGNQI